jgi:hypothetical protein
MFSPTTQNFARRRNFIAAYRNEKRRFDPVKRALLQQGDACVEKSSAFGEADDKDNVIVNIGRYGHFVSLPRLPV